MSAAETHRVYVRLDEDDLALVDYWAKKRGMSRQEFAREAILREVRHANYDYDVPNLMVARQGQLIDAIERLAVNDEMLTDVVTAGFNALLGLTRGENYLLEVDGGDE